MRQIFIGKKGREKCFLIKNNKIIAEVLKGGQICKIKLINYNGEDGKVKKYYIKHGNYIIGWINKDLSLCQAKNSSQEDILINILSAMKKLSSKKAQLCQ